METAPPRPGDESPLQEAAPAPQPEDAPDLLGPTAPGEAPIERAIRNAAMRAVVLAAFLVAAGMLFHELVTLVAAGVITCIVAILLSSVAAPLERRGVPRPVGALAAVLALLALVGGLLVLVVPTVVRQVREFADALPGLADDLAGQYAAITGGEPANAGDRLERAMDRLGSDPGRFLGPVASLGLGVLGIVSALVVILITAFYMAARPEPLLEGVCRVFPEHRREWAMRVADRLRVAWAGWMKGVAFDMLVTGVLLYAGLRLVGLEFAGMFAALSALLVVVPYFGAIAAGVPPVLVALAESTELGLLTLGVYLLVQQIESNVVVPLVMARVVELHPAVIAVGVVVVAQLFGVIGLLVAVPLCSAFVILVEELWVRPLEHNGVHEPAGAPAVVPRRGIAGLRRRDGGR